jgi:hypothetical protein
VANTSQRNFRAAPAQSWVAASPASVGVGNWSEFSAVCFVTGRTIFKGLGGARPLGLIVSAYSGTGIQAWSSPAVLAACALPAPPNPAQEPDLFTPSVVYNAMLAPVFTGPLALAGMVWFQGESNAEAVQYTTGQVPYYACAFPAVISDYRSSLGVPNLWFGFVQLSPFTLNAVGAAPIRNAQQAALALANVSLASALDCGWPLSPWKDIHSQVKYPVGARMGWAALAKVYGLAYPATTTLYGSANATTVGNTATVEIVFDAATQSDAIVLVNASCPVGQGAVTAADCAWFGIQASDGNWYNATPSLTYSQQQVLLTATLASPGLAVVATQYAWGPWPVVMLYSSQGLPLAPWYENVTSAVVLPAAAPATVAALRL